MEKELKPCTCVLLRANLIGHGHPSPFAKKGEMAVPPVRSALKRTPMQDFKFYYIFITTYQNIGDLFCLAIFMDFRTVCFVKISIDFFFVISMILYLCILDKPTQMLVSFLGSRDFSTSDFKRRSKKGFSTPCKRATRLSSPEKISLH